MAESSVASAERVPLLQQRREVDTTEVYPVIQSVRSVSTSYFSFVKLLLRSFRTLWWVYCASPEHNLKWADTLWPRLQ